MCNVLYLSIYLSCARYTQLQSPKIVDPYLLEALGAGLPGGGAAPQGCNAEEERLWGNAHTALKNIEVRETIMSCVCVCVC